MALYEEKPNEVITGISPTTKSDMYVSKSVKSNVLEIRKITNGITTTLASLNSVFTPFIDKKLNPMGDTSMGVHGKK